MVTITVNCVAGWSRRRATAELFAGIRVGIKSGCAARSDMHAEAMALIEDDAGGPKVQIEFINFPWFEQAFSTERCVKASADSAVTDIERASIGIDIA